ncbi:MAG TPA: hypothetical protein VGE10_05645 [Zeimonas sp.]
MNSKRILVPLAVAATLYGCGGGGGDNDPIAPDLTQITESNAQKSVGTVYRAGASLYDASYLSSDLAEDIASLKSVPGERTSLVAFSVQRLDDMTRIAVARDAADLSNGVAKKETSSETMACSEGGTMTVTADLQDPDRISSGDRITGVFASCVESGVRIDGKMTIGDLALGDRIAALFLFEDLRITDGADAGQVDGAFHLSMPATFDHSRLVSIDLTRISLRVAANGRTATLQDVTSHAEIVFMTDEFRYTLQGRIADSGDGVSVDVTTETPFAGVGPNLLEGALRIAGAASSSARAIVSSPDHVTIEVDADGNGTYEQTLDEVHVSAL